VLLSKPSLWQSFIRRCTLAADRGKFHPHSIIRFPVWLNIFNKHNHSHRHQISKLTVSWKKYYVVPVAWKACTQCTLLEIKSSWLREQRWWAMNSASEHGNSDFSTRLGGCLVTARLKKLYMNSDRTDAAGFIKLFTETSFAPSSLWAFTFQLLFFLSPTQLSGGSHCSLFHSRWMTFTTMLLINF
jgi:hypothetical protein